MGIWYSQRLQTRTGIRESSSEPQPSTFCNDHNSKTSGGTSGSQEEGVSPATASSSPLQPGRTPLDTAHTHCPHAFPGQLKNPCPSLRPPCTMEGCKSVCHISPDYTNVFPKPLLMCQVLKVPSQLSGALLRSLQFVSFSCWISTAGYRPQTRGWSILSSLLTRTLRVFCSEVLPASLPAAGSAGLALHLFLWKFLRILQPTLSLLRACQPCPPAY